MVLSMNGIWVSTHMPLARHDIDDQKKEELSKFLLTCLLRGMTHVAQKNTVFLVFLLTCLLRGMTKYTGGQQKRNEVSTHMPLARHDVVQ